MKKLLFLFITVSLLACEDDEGTVTRLRINHYQQTATFLTDYFTLVTQDEAQFGTDQWTFHHSNIEGFEYDWGYTYELVVQRVKLKDPPQDISSIKTTLVRIVSKERIPDDTPFEIRLTRAYDGGGYDNFLRGNSSSSYTILGSVAIDCGNLCDELSQGLSAEESMVGVFNHLEEGVRLIELKKK